VIQDTPIHQDVLSYGQAQFVLKNMDEAEFELYTKIYTAFVKRLPKPTLILYLDAKIETLFKRISKRSRSFERKIPEKYLKILDRLNRSWVRKLDHYRVLRIKTDKLNLVDNKDDIDFLISKVKDRLLEQALSNKFDGYDGELKKAKVILLCGMPGCGKSTIAKNLSQILNAELLISDKIREEAFKSVRYDPRGDVSVLKIRPKYYARLWEGIKKCILNNRKVVVDASNMDKQRARLIKKIDKLVGKENIVILRVKTAKKMIAKRMKQIEGMASEKEDFYSGWRRVYGYYEEHLKDKSYFWPTEEEGVKILEILND